MSDLVNIDGLTKAEVLWALHGELSFEDAKQIIDNRTNINMNDIGPFDKYFHDHIGDDVLLDESKRFYFGFIGTVPLYVNIGGNTFNPQKYDLLQYNRFSGAALNNITFARSKKAKKMMQANKSSLKDTSFSSNFSSINSILKRIKFGN